MDGGAWEAAVHGVMKSRTRLSDFTFTFSLSCIGERNGNPLQCSCLENPRDGGAWWAALSGVAQSRTQLKRHSSSSSSSSSMVLLIISKQVTQFVFLIQVVSSTSDMDILDIYFSMFLRLLKSNISKLIPQDSEKFCFLGDFRHFCRTVDKLLVLEIILRNRAKEAPKTASWMEDGREG